MALTFGAATSDRVQLPAGLNNLNAFTVLMWSFCTTHTDLRHLFAKGNVGGRKKAQLNATTTVDFQVTRATTVARALAADNTNELNKWLCWAFTFDDTDGPRIFKGSLDGSIAEVAYAAVNPVVGAGAVTDDSDNVWFVGNNNALTRAFQGRIAVAAHFRRRMTLGEIRAWQFRPYTDADCDISFHLGFNGTATQPNWTTLGAGINGTVTGATVGAHVPLGPPFGLDALWVPASAAAGLTAAGAIASAEAFGTPNLIRWVREAGGIASAEAFGQPTLGTTLLFAVGGIASAEALGQPKLTRILRPVAILSEEAFGTAALVRRIRQAGGIASEEALGQVRVLRGVRGQGIASAEAVGAPRIVRLIYPVSIASLEAFGIATLADLSGVVGAVYGQALVSDSLRYGLLVSDDELYLVQVSDVERFGVRASDRPGG